MKTWKNKAAVWVTSLLALSACGDSDEAKYADAGPRLDASQNVDAAVPPDAAIPLTGIDALCAPDGPFPALFRKQLACNNSLAFISVQGTGLLSDFFLEDLCRANFGPAVEGETVSIDDTTLQACLDYVNETDCQLIDIDRIVGTPCNDNQESVWLPGSKAIAAKRQTQTDPFVTPSTTAMKERARPIAITRVSAQLRNEKQVPLLVR